MEEGWGVIDSQETPGGCWVHFSVISISMGSSGFRKLTVGRLVSFDWEPVSQDGFAYRATNVWPPGGQVAPAQQSDSEPSAAYRSSLVIRYDDES